MSIKTTKPESGAEKFAQQDEKPPRIDFADAIRIMLDTEPLPKKKLIPVRPRQAKDKSE